MSILCIIPARSGSKGLKNKNIMPLGGKPLLSYTINAAKKSKVFTDVLVSTDSIEYKEIADSYGAWVPFLRDKNISGDKSTTAEAILDVLEKLDKLGKTYNNLAILQPTSPLRNHNHIQEAYNLFSEKEANAVVSVTEMDHSPLWSNTIKEDLNIDNFISTECTLRQDLKTYYRINGAIYISKVDYYLKYKNLYYNKSYAYIMDKKYSVDIDDLFDFRFAEFLLNYNQT